MARARSFPFTKVVKVELEYNIDFQLFVLFAFIVYSMSSKGLKHGAHRFCDQECTESAKGTWAEPVAHVADIEEDPNIVDSDDDFVVDEIVFDEIDDFELVQELQPALPAESTFQHQQGPQVVPERSIATPSIDVQQPPIASQGWVMFSVFRRSFLLNYTQLWKLIKDIVHIVLENTP